MKLTKVKLIEITLGASSAKAYTRINIRDGELWGTDYEFIPMPLLPDGLEPGVYSPTFQKLSLENWVEPSSWLPDFIHRDFAAIMMLPDKTWTLLKEVPVDAYYIEHMDTYDLPKNLFDTKPDPLGWENSLHVRTEDGKWVRA